MNRILDLPPEDLTAEQKTVFDNLTAGRGRILGPYRVWIHSPTVAAGMEHIGTFLNKRSSLSTREVEIGILVIAQHWDANYVRQAHIKAGKAAGLSDATIDAILAGRDPGLTDQLTPRELQVAVAVAGGSTNREVGAELFLSPKTVELHLSRIYRKLGVRSRIELARRLPGDERPPA